MKIPQKSYQEPHPRVIATWAPAGVRGALQLLQHGNFTQAGYLLDAVLGDDRVQAAIGTRVNGVLSLPLLFDPAEDERRHQEAAQALAAVWWEIAPETALDQLLTYGRLLGAALAELVWATEDGAALPRLRVWHPSLLRFDPRSREWRVRQEPGELTITPGDGKWFLFAPYGERRPSTKALLRGLAIPWLAKQYAIGDWQRYSEMHGGPIRAGVTPAGAKEGDRTTFLNDLDRLASDTAIVLPEGFDLKMIEASGKSFEAFEHLIEWCDKAMTVAILGQNLTTQVEGGSLAAAQVHDNVRLDLVRSDTESLATGLREQVVSWWAEFNLGDRALAPWPRWQADPPDDLAQQAETYLKLSQALGNFAGVGVEVGPILEKYGLEASITPALSQIRLASRDRPSAARGFVRGQLYTDALDDSARLVGAEALRPDLRALLDIIESAADYEELRRRIIDAYGAMAPEALADLLEKALILADLAGRAAVLEDA